MAHVFLPLHWDFPDQPPHPGAPGQAPGRARILDLTESNPTRAGFEYRREIVRAFDERAACWSTSLRPAPSRPRSGCVLLRVGGERVDTGRILLTASTTKLMPGSSSCSATPATTSWFPRPSLSVVRVLANLESVEVGHTRWSTMAAGALIWTRSPPPFPNARAPWCWSIPTTHRLLRETGGAACVGRGCAPSGNRADFRRGLLRLRLRGSPPGAKAAERVPTWWASRSAWHFP